MKLDDLAGQIIDSVLALCLCQVEFLEPRKGVLSLFD
jgi:hypothetical protein